jgi:hypothetical protein
MISLNNNNNNNAKNGSAGGGSVSEKSQEKATTKSLNPNPKKARIESEMKSSAEKFSVLNNNNISQTRVFQPQISQSTNIYMPHHHHQHLNNLSHSNNNNVLDMPRLCRGGGENLTGIYQNNSNSIPYLNNHNISNKSSSYVQSPFDYYANLFNYHSLQTNQESNSTENFKKNMLEILNAMMPQLFTLMNNNNNGSSTISPSSIDPYVLSFLAAFNANHNNNNNTNNNLNSHDK